MHHAQLIQGWYNNVAEALVAHLKEHKMPTSGHPDFLVHTTDIFGIDDARFLQERVLRQPIQGEIKVFIIGARQFTGEAQNALLKVCEEPTAGTRIFLIVPHVGELFPTLRSRFVPLTLVGVSETEEESFLSLSRSDRLARVTELVKNMEEGGHASVLHFVEGLIRIAAQEKAWESLAVLGQAERDLQARGVPPRFVLEDLAVRLPVKGA